ncbi:MAG: hypothetical protein ACYC3I_08985, partial [Gemmataceae bacterium]
ALTDWQPPKGPKQHLLFPEMEEERDKAEAVKQRKPLLVVLGNPPYNGFAGVGVTEERDLSDAYRTTERAPKPQGQGLNVRREGLSRLLRTTKNACFSGIFEAPV